MIELFKRIYNKDKEKYEYVYWSKSSAFLVPLTGIRVIPEMDIKGYIRWENYSIHNYELIVKVEYGHNYDVFQEYLKSKLLYDGKAFAREIYDFEGFSIIIFDVSEWKNDIDKFIKGKYSHLSNEAKDAIISYHTVIHDNKSEISIIISSCLYPKKAEQVLDNMTPLEYAIKHYVSTKPIGKIDKDTEDTWRYIGEMCSKCDEYLETLVLDNSQSVIPVQLE